MLPNFLGIGAPKCGTTWLAACLGEHPDVHVAPVKETNFLHYEHIDGRLAEYEKHFEAAGPRRAVGEISVRYLASPRAPQRVRELLPRARLFVSLRNPVEQIYSNYWHLQRQGFHDPALRGTLSLEQALERYAPILLEPARYGRQLEQWTQRFPREQLQVILFDDIRARPEAVMAQLYRHLGVDPEFAPPSLRRRDSDTRAGTSPRGPLSDRVYRNLYGALVRRAYTPLKRLLGVRRAAMLKDRLRVRQMLERTFRRAGYPPLARQQRQHLLGLLREDITVLEALTGRSLRTWSAAP